MENKKQKLDWEAVRVKLDGDKKGEYWRSLDELAETDEHKLWLEDEFPHRKDLPSVDRRNFLKLMGASMALAGMVGCRNLPQERLVPHIKSPEDRPEGSVQYYASTMPFGGYGFPVLVESHEGRPTKLEGNPDHPASGGASDIFTQAEILNMYDPDRSQNVVNDGLITTWDEFFTTMKRQLESTKGKGMGFLTGRVTSPTLINRLEKLAAKYPALKWYQWETAHNDGQLDAIGPHNPIYDFANAKTILSLDGDFLGSNPHTVQYATAFAARRDPALGENMTRLYAVEAAPSNTGACSDHRLPVKPTDVYAVAAIIATELGVPGVHAALKPPEVKRNWIDAVLADFRTRGGFVYVGEHQPAAVHALAHAINLRFGHVKYVQAPEFRPVNKRDSLKALTDDLNSKAITNLTILGGNPVYGCPGDVRFGEALVKAQYSAYLGFFENETSKLCKWVLPEAHFLEAWGDNVTPQGDITIQQPLIEPIYRGKSALELALSLLGEPITAEAAVRASYPKLSSRVAWEAALNKGYIQGAAVEVRETVSPALKAERAKLADLQANRATNDPELLNQWTTVTNLEKTDATGIKPNMVPMRASTGSGDIEAILVPDPTIHDGFYANNGWLQELPKPLTKLTWDNAVLISPKTAEQNGLQDEDKINVISGGYEVEACVFIQVGHADGAATLHMGGDRKHGGRVLHNCGFDFMKLRRASAYCKVELAKIGGTYPLATSQAHHSMEGRDIIREGAWSDLAKNPTLMPEGHEEEVFETMYNLTEEWSEANKELPQWAMTIDLNYCVGCNACVTACQSENNIPTVGKAEVSRGRELHWIRVDRYYKVTEGSEHRDLRTGTMGSAGVSFESPARASGSGPLRDDIALSPATVTTVFQPVPCMHCELAPCEPVCPVAATVHSHEGLNQMVYNRCVGTRYCSNNCPYKVRRFNYYNYQHGQVDATFKNNDRRTKDEPLMGKKYGQANFQGEKDIPLLRLLNNPDVTVRGRGVMEKCTYCVQRINEARITAKKENKPLGQIQVVTACQQACPTHAITFGNMADPKSAVSQKRADKRNYSLLAHIGTKPRTTYLGRVRNPNPTLEGKA